MNAYSQQLELEYQLCQNLAYSKGLDGFMMYKTPVALTVRTEGERMFTKSSEESRTAAPQVADTLYHMTCMQ